MKKRIKQLNLHINIDLKRKLDKIAKIEKRSTTNLIIFILEKYKEDYEKLSEQEQSATL